MDTNENKTKEDGQAPDHLIWRLNHFGNHERAIKFAKQFQNTLCVYSGPVSQLYTNYEINVPEDDERSLVILPNPYAYHDTYNGIDESCVKPTGFTVIPGEMLGKTGLFLTLPFRKKNGELDSRPVPLKAGLYALIKNEKPDDPFLPVITKGDLRSFRKDAPCLHLHRIQPNKLAERSAMEVSGIKNVIREKMKAYL